MKPSSLLFAFPAMLPLCTLAAVAPTTDTAPEVTAPPVSSRTDVSSLPSGLHQDGLYTLRDRGTFKDFQIVTTELYCKHADATTSIHPLTTTTLSEARAEALRLRAETGDLYSFLIHPAGQPRTEENQMLVTAKVCVQLEPGVDAAALAALTGALDFRQPRYSPDHCIFEYGDGGGALLAQEILETQAGVSKSEVLLARRYKQTGLPDDPYFAPKAGNLNYKTVINLDLADKDPSRIATPLARLAVTPAYQWYLLNTGDLDNLPNSRPNPDIGPSIAPIFPPDWPKIEDPFPLIPNPRNPLEDRRMDINMIVRKYDDFGNLVQTYNNWEGDIDSDGDGYNDDNEALWRTDPKDPNSHPPELYRERISRPMARGTGVKVAVLDDGIDYSHPDFLLTNYQRSLDYNFNENTEDAKPPATRLATATHGTGAAGLVAARYNNNRDTTGIAPDSQLIGLRILDGFVDDESYSNAIAWKSTNNTINDVNLRSGNVVSDVSLNPYQLGSGGSTLYAESELFRDALKYGIERGRAGLGVVYVFSSGNDALLNGQYSDAAYSGSNQRRWMMDVNFRESAASRYTIAVGSVTDYGRTTEYSVGGSALNVVAPSGGWELPPRIVKGGALWPSVAQAAAGITVTPEDVPIATIATNKRRRSQELVTLSTNNSITTSYTGTSGSAAITAGVIALMLEANPTLSWRDVQEILQRSAQIVNPYYGGWVPGALGHGVSYLYGWGCVDADHALRMARAWTNLPPEQKLTGGFMTMNRSIRDNFTLFGGTSVNIGRPQPGFRIEHVEVEIGVSHPRRGDLSISLVAPEVGKSVGPIESKLYVAHREDFNGNTMPPLTDNDEDNLAMLWKFSSVRHWGSIYDGGGLGGDWLLKVADVHALGTSPASPVVGTGNGGTGGLLKRAAITYYGTSAPDANFPPVIGNSGFIGARNRPFSAYIAVNTPEKAPIEEYTFRILAPIPPTTGLPWRADIPVPPAVDLDPNQFIVPDPYSGDITGRATRNGQWDVEVTATNVFGKTTSNLVLTIRDTYTYSVWQTFFFPRTSLATDAGLQEDPDGDGIVNFMEFATGGNPLVADGPMPGFGFDGDTQYMFYVKDKNAVPPRLVPETSVDLTKWESLEPELIDTVGAIETYRAPLPEFDEQRRFFRLKATTALPPAP